MTRTLANKPPNSPAEGAANGVGAASHPPTGRDLELAFLRANSAGYQYLVDRIRNVRDPFKVSRTLKAVAEAAAFACGFHTGRFADGALENVLLSIGQSIESPRVAEDRQRAADTPLRVLHVATHVFAVGGHTRMLHRWISADHDNCHSVVLTEQKSYVIPSWLTEEVESTGGAMLHLVESMSPCERAAQLRELALEFADLVVVHHSGADVIPSLAFANNGGPPVAILNHADHGFWLGSSVADACINLRSITNEYSVSRRYIPTTAVLPIPLPAPSKKLDRAAARRTLGVGPDVVMLLTVARAIKFRPCAGQDFMATVETVLNEDPNFHLYVIGETAEGLNRKLDRVLHPRIHCVGPIENPAPHRAAADIYIESFPFGSNTSLLEAALDGLAVVPACRPLTKLLVACNDSLTDVVSNPATEAAYCERIRFLARNPAQRQAFGLRLRQELLAHHVGAAWQGHLQAVYRATTGLVHRPRAIPVTVCETTSCDIGLSLFNALSNGRSRGGDPLTQLSTIRHWAFVAKHVRDFRVARALSFSALRIDFFGAETWRLFVVSLLGPVGRAAGKCARHFGRAT